MAAPAARPAPAATKKTVARKKAAPKTSDK
jgi:hypothetical protein